MEPWRARPGTPRRNDPYAAFDEPISDSARPNDREIATQSDYLGQAIGIAGIVFALSALFLPYFAAVFFIPAAVICGLIALGRGHAGLGCATIIVAALALVGVFVVSRAIQQIL